ncbi:MAG: hypothetical protein ACE5MM_08425 [Nitrospiraceae bacterium]
MKIRRKTPKPSTSGRPLFVIGYTSASPALSDLRSWFNLEYGGPIAFQEHPREREEVDIGSPMVTATHGPWKATCRASLPIAEADEWRNRLDWLHPLAGSVFAIRTTPREASDAVLLAARLARGLTLLTDGTAYDLITRTYLNPSDWQDRPLDRFRTGDHVTVVQAEGTTSHQEWFHTRGLSKFGLDEIELFRPVGLPSRAVTEDMAAIADELVQIGHPQKVGATVRFEGAGLLVRVIRHRTASASGAPLALREIVWESLPADR